MDVRKKWRSKEAEGMRRERKRIKERGKKKMDECEEKEDTDEDTFTKEGIKEVSKKEEIGRREEIKPLTCEIT